MLKGAFGAAIGLLATTAMTGCAGDTGQTVQPIGPLPTTSQTVNESPSVLDGAPLAGTPISSDPAAQQGSPDLPVASAGTAEATSSPGLPCDIAQVLQDHCWKCHGETTNWGGPMSLTQHQHFAEAGKLTTDARVIDLVRARINDSSKPMPPPTEDPMPPEAIALLNQWLDGGAKAGTESACTLRPSPALIEAPVDESTHWQGVESSWPGGVKPEETCYQFLKHGGQTPQDATKHITEVNETYVNFYYKVPWAEPVVATRWRTIYDNTQVLHHWLLYKSPASANLDGTWAAGLGTHPGAQLLAGWAVGGGDEDFPPGVGLRMPAPGTLLELEWHLYNTTGAPVPDQSGIEICVVPESAVDPQFVAGLTWLGTEDLFLPPNQETARGGMCEPSFKNGGPIHIVKWLPHMHLAGKHMDTWVLRADGTEEHVFSEPFTFDQQISYVQNPPVIVNPGDRVFAQCTYHNTTSAAVLFGESTNEEMCYQFAIAYPAGSLDSGSLTWNGSDNTCMSFNTTK